MFDVLIVLALFQIGVRLGWWPMDVPSLVHFALIGLTACGIGGFLVSLGKELGRR